MRKGWYLRGVRLGEWDLLTDPDCDANTNVCAPPVLEQGISQVMVHSNFVPNSKEQFNDIALVKMRSSVEYSDYVKPICLPESSFEQSFDDSPLVVAGFGKTEYSDDSRIKLKTDLQGTSFQKCRQVYGQARIADSQICAIGDFGRDSWWVNRHIKVRFVKNVQNINSNGDSGQPLLSVNTNVSPARWELVGVVSYGPSPCAQQDKPGVYTRISSYLPWIQDNMVWAQKTLVHLERIFVVKESLTDDTSKQIKEFFFFKFLFSQFYYNLHKNFSLYHRYQYKDNIHIAFAWSLRTSNPFIRFIDLKFGLRKDFFCFP